MYRQFSQGWLSKDYSKVKHQIIKLDGLSQLLNSSLVEGGTDVPEGHYAEENMKATVVPNRNKIFASLNSEDFKRLHIFYFICYYSISFPSVTFLNF